MINENGVDDARLEDAEGALVVQRLVQRSDHRVVQRLSWGVGTCHYCPIQTLTWDVGTYHCWPIQTLGTPNSLGA